MNRNGSQNSLHNKSPSHNNNYSALTPHKQEPNKSSYHLPTIGEIKPQMKLPELEIPKRDVQIDFMEMENNLIRRLKMDAQQ